MKALIDVEIIIHRAFAAAGDMALVPNVLNDCIHKVWEWRGFAGNAEPVLCFSGRGNFRKRLCPDYKSHRAPKPDGYDAVVDGLKRHFDGQWYCFQGLEADDVMGILQTSPKFGETRIISIDKDMKTIPGWLINPDKWPEEYGCISEEDADLHWIRQTVIGDTADGFKGIPKAGPVAAEKINCWDDVFALAEKKGLERDYVILQARLARILRRDDYDAQSQTVRLWHPDAPEEICLDSAAPAG